MLHLMELHLNCVRNQDGDNFNLHPIEERTYKELYFTDKNLNFEG